MSYGNKSLEDYKYEIARINEANGWFDSERTFGDEIALIHSEVSEALEEFRTHGFEDKTIELCCRNKFNNDLVAHDKSLHNNGHVCKPEGIGSELADILVRVLDTCHRHDIDLEKELRRKLRYNATRGYRHGGKNLQDAP